MRKSLSAGLVAVTAFSISPEAQSLQTLCEMTHCVSDSLPLTNTSWSDEVIIERFDPDLGTLTGVEVTLTANIQGDVQIESLDGFPSVVTTTYSAQVSVLRPDGMSPFATVSPSELFINNLAAFDGTIDFAGPSGVTFPSINETQVATFTGPPPISDLALFQGIGGLALPVIAVASSSIVGAGNVASIVQQSASVTVDVCYTYTAHCVSEIESVPLTTTNWNDLLTFDKFDPDLGVLKNVVVNLEANLQGSAAVESQNNEGSNVNVTFAANISVFRPTAGPSIATVVPQQSFNLPLPPFDGVLDFGGPSSATFPGLNLTESETHIAPPPPSDLALFTGVGGAGSPGTIDLPVVATGRSSGSGAGGLALLFMQQVSATVEVCYIYEPDCDMNGVGDIHEVFSDCNLNGVPDVCDVLQGASDVNGDNVPDECNTGVNLCNGDGGNQAGCTDCPCGNNASPGTIGGCLNSAGTSARLLVNGDASVSLPSGSVTDLRFSLASATPFCLCILSSGNTVAPNSLTNPCFGLYSGVAGSAFDGLRCAIMGFQRHGGRPSDSFGDVGVTNFPWGGEGFPNDGIAQTAGFTGGQTRYFQVIHRDVDFPSSPCGTNLNTSQAVGITFLP